MQTKFYLALLGTLIPFLLWAGDGKTPPKKVARTWDKTLMLRVKPEFRSVLQKKDFLHPAAQSLFAQLGLKRFFARFPHRQAPANPIHSSGERIPDMSLIYQLEYQGKVNLEDAIRMAMRSGLFEYAEPKFIRETCLVPNDPAVNQQYYLDSVQAYQAWDITEGDTNVVMGIIDSGVQTNHSDLASQMKVDPSDPVNGVDDNNDGKIDNNMGWDFCGATFDPAFEGDRDANIISVGASHGTHVAGTAGARVNNGLGIAGLGNKCKIMPLKCSPDNGGQSIFYGYEAIEYGASHGADVLNCSWGGPGFSNFESEVIADATLTFGTLVVAAAGNDNSPELFYPAYYNHVLAVSALGPGNRRANFTNYNYRVRVAAPGVNIYSTYFNNAYVNNSGTSMASPVVCGIAALVRSRFPNLTPDQVAQRIRVTSDNIYNVAGNGGASFFMKYGRGIANAYRAVVEQTPGIQNIAIRVTDGNNDLFQPGDTLYITGDFINRLQASSPNLKVAFSVVASSTSTFITPITSTSEVILGEMTTDQIKNSNGKPFKIFLKPNLPTDRTIDLRMHYTDGAYYDYDHYSITLNPTYLNVEKNNISTTLTSRGRIGFNDDGAGEGLGFKHKGRQTLFELGLMTGTSVSKIASTVRNATTGASAVHDNDYRNLQIIKEITPPMEGVFRYTNLMSDAGAGTATSNIDILQQSYAYTTPGDSNHIIVKYSIRNKNQTPLTGFYVGLYGDFDISTNGQQDRAGWMDGPKLGYTYNTNPDGLYAGVAVLGAEATPAYYAIDNDATAADTFGVYDGFTDQEKFFSLSNGLYRRNAGVPTAKDVSLVVGSGPYTIAPNDTLHVGFAVVAGENLQQIIDAAEEAQDQWPLITSTRSRFSKIGSFQVYPNPVKDRLWVKDNFTQAGQLEIRDLQGRLIRELRPGEDGSVRVSGLQPGVYIGTSASGGVFRFVKE
jgi:serine protease